MQQVGVVAGFGPAPRVIFAELRGINSKKKNKKRKETPKNPTRPSHFHWALLFQDFWNESVLPATKAGDAGGSMRSSAQLDGPALEALAALPEARSGNESGGVFDVLPGVTP